MVRAQASVDLGKTDKAEERVEPVVATSSTRITLYLSFNDLSFNIWKDEDRLVLRNDLFLICACGWVFLARIKILGLKGKFNFEDNSLQNSSDWLKPRQRARE